VVGRIGANGLADGFGEGLGLIPGHLATGVGGDGDDDMQALAAGGLDEGGRPNVLAPAGGSCPN
jgi:hypothetical protein